MRCQGCGFALRASQAPVDQKCMTCGKPLHLDSDDLLMHGYGATGTHREIRQGQIEMGRLVESVIGKKELAIIEGPVGSGKSDGYGIPAVLSGKRIVIATAKKQLQHQIARKDIPYIAQRIGKDVTVALLKGKANYACRVRAEKNTKMGAEAKPFMKWLSESEYGDGTDYPGRKPFFWNDVTAEDCVGSRCKYATTETSCGYWRTKLQSKAAQVVIANHHVVAFDLRFGPYKLLGPYDVLIIDEAHQVQSAFRGAYSKSVSPYTVQKILNQLDGLNLPLAAEEKVLLEVWKQMFEAVRDLDGEVPRDPFGEAGVAGIAALKKMDDYVAAEMKEHDIGLDENGEIEPPKARGGTWVGKKDRDHTVALEMLRRTIARPLEALSEMQTPNDNTVIYVNTTDKKTKIVNVAPITVGPLIGPKLRMIPTVIVTSATIAINGTFDDIKNQLGLNYKPPETATPPSISTEDEEAPTPEELEALEAYSDPEKKIVRELILSTPFDYNTQALLYVPKCVPLPAGPTAPEPDRAKYLMAVTSECARLIQAADGDAFILFTSTKDMNDVHALLLEESLTNPLIIQGDDAEAALKEFLKTPRSVILGLKSFWEGVDVVGDKLRLVIITKLPFPMVSDPVIKARERQIIARSTEAGMTESAARSKVFNTLQIPMMITDLRQGAGRLIRSRKDRGVLAILDCRIWTGNGKQTPTATTRSHRGYGDSIIKALGFTQRTSEFGIVKEILKFWMAESARAKPSS